MTSTIGAMLLLLAAAALAELSAQAVSRMDRASLQLPVVITVGYRLHVSPRAPAAFVATSPDFAEVELPLTAAANVAWSLAVSLPETDVGGTVLAVQNAKGEWEVPVAGRRILVVARRDPTNPIDLRVRVRIARGVPAESAERLRLHLELAAESAP